MANNRIEAPVESFTVRSPDGLSIRVHRAGAGPHRWLIPPGMGTPLLCWKHVFETFHDRMTLVTWDQRGTYGSDSPRGRGGLAFERHVDDALAILDAVGWDEPFVTGSWSMGVQIGLSLYERMPDRIAGLALINGAFEHVLRTAYGPPATAPLLRFALRSTVAASPVLAPVARRFFRSGLAGELMDRLHVSNNNKDFVVPVTQELSRVDLGNYFRILLELDKHSARSVLAKVRVPTLVTAGSRDVATPPAAARELHRLIAGSDYVEIEGGTHYTPLEFPEALNAALERFFSERVFPRTWAR